jgi:HK97 gp10 family phage protein
MAGDSVFVSIKGLPDLRAAMRDVVPKLRIKVLRQALTAGARIVQKAARSRTPILKLTTFGGRAAYRRGVRKPGTVRNAISVRTSKASKRRGDVGVFVNVRPVKGIRSGARSSNDPFYWRWLNFGNKWKTGAGFLEYGASKLPEALSIFNAKLTQAIAKLNNKQTP